MPIEDLELARRVDLLCREFEGAWRGERPLSIEEVLAKVDDPDRELLLVELISLECELLGGRGEAVDRDDYLRRFPTLTRAVDRAFQSTVRVGPPASEPTEARTIPPGHGSAGPDTEAATIPPRIAPEVEETVNLNEVHSGREMAGADQTTDLGGPRAVDPELGTVRYFGDYELIKEIARGGMGVVFRARQVSLNRPVALKMILAGQLAGEEEVHRFHLEAEAAANLDHPGIVPIYEIGEHRGQHFFSMGFVEGTSLVAMVAEGPLPPREAASMTRLVAEAMQYAHERDVIHRDLKPANVLIDRQGRPKVTDFGLAKKLKADSGLTHTGQVMGTPSYMPPEQASGRADIGPLADVYSLGAVLYHLITGRPPFQAASVMDVLMQVVDRDPISPRQLNPSIPRDLETICLKAMQKEPVRRYESAGALAEDLGRWLSGETILARPVGSAERAWRWCRRNPGLAAALGSAAAMLVAIAVLSLIYADRQARDARRIDGLNKDLKEANRLAGDEARRASASASKAIEEAKRADANASTARRAVNEYLDRITASPQLRRPGLAGIRRDLLKQGLSYYEGFLLESAADPKLRAEAADAQNRAAMIFSELGDTVRSTEASRRAVDLNETLLRERPGDRAARHRLSSSLVSLGNVLRHTRQSDAAIETYRRAAEISEALLKDEPEDHDVASDLSVAWSNLANAYADAGKTEEVRSVLARARSFLEAFVARVPSYLRARDLLATILHQLGDQASDRGEYEPALDLYRKAEELREGILREAPDDPQELSELARLENELGMLLFHHQHYAEAQPYLEKGRSAREKLLAAEPASAELKEYLSRSLDNLGNLFNATGRAAEASPRLERAVELRGQVVAADPGNASVRGALGGSLHNLSMSFERLGKLDDAEKLYRQAIEHQRRAIRDQPDVVVHRAYMTNHLLGLGDLLRRRGRVDQAIALGEEVPGLWAAPQANPIMRSALFLISCVASVEGDSPESKALRDRAGLAAVGALSKAVDGGLQAVEFFRDSPQLNPIRDRVDFKALLHKVDPLSP